MFGLVNFVEGALRQVKVVLRMHFLKQFKYLFQILLFYGGWSVQNSTNKLN